MSILRRFLADKKVKWLLFFAAVSYIIILQFIYITYWNPTKQIEEVVDGRHTGRYNYSSSSLHFQPLVLPKKSSSTSLPGNVVGKTSTPDLLMQHQADVHVPDPVLKHAGELHSSTSVNRRDVKNGRGRQPRATIAVGGGITSRNITNISESSISSQFMFLGLFLPTLCRTASPQFAYRIYLGYDHTDPVFGNGRLQAAFRRAFDAVARRRCTDVDISLFLIQCNYTGKPTWAQNNAMMEAYLDHVDYFYRVNDDTTLMTGGWTQKFIAALNGYNPPRVGVVGPNHLDSNNIPILTYDFVHRTHIDVFGFYYPHVFTDWWADRWITRVYAPKRKKKLFKVQLTHTMLLGRRYDVQWNASLHLDKQVELGKKTLKRYIKAVRGNKAWRVKPDGRKVISMSLYGKDPRYTWGVIRNAQQVPVYLPEWTLRVYVAAEPAPTELAVPPRIINKLRLLGAEVAYVSATGNSMAPRNWRLLAADDQRLDYFLVRDADSRLSDREASAVRDWVSTAKKNGSRSGVVHCVRDHPKHADRAIVDGLWGGRPRSLYQLLRQNISQMMIMQDVGGFLLNSLWISSVKGRRNGGVLGRVLWPAVGNWSYCHDSVSPCDRWTSRQPFPTSRQGHEYVGQKFDAYQELVSTDGDQLTTDVVCGLNTLNKSGNTQSQSTSNSSTVKS